MKNKLWIKSRVFLSFLIFTIFIVNIFAYLLYFFVSENIKDNLYNSIKNEYQTISAFIDLQSSNIFSLPKYEVEKINNLWFYFYIWNNDLNLQKNYKLWFYNNEKEILFRWDYKWYNIVIWKNLNDFNHFKETYLEILIILNVIFIILSIILSYFIAKYSLKPFLDLSEYLNKYNFKSNFNLLKNKYWDSEIWQLTKAINNFINNNNKTLEIQTDFIQDVSHELKTPLMQIESNIELIEDKIIDEKIKIKLENIKKSSNNMNEIISNLWFILRWEKVNKNNKQINLYTYFLEFIKKYDILTNQKNIDIKIINNYDLIINNNSYYLDRLFWNIISNAIFYNKWNNAITITMNKNSVVIEDKWIWIKKDEAEKIFTRFYRNQNSWVYYKNWNWLWLVIAKKICAMFGWEIRVESDLWKWSKISIIF